MAAIPFATHTAHKVHGNLSKSYRQKWEEKMGFNMAGDEFSETTTTPSFNTKMNSEYQNVEPLSKYNSKLMNSIWGLYNRYSVHNMKQVADTPSVQGEKGTQSVTVSPTAMGSVEMLLYGPLSLGTFWDKLSGAQTH